MTTFGKIRLGETLTFQRGYDITKAEQTPGGVPIVSSSGISSYHNVAKQGAPGVIIGRKGTLGTVHLVASRYWPHDTTLWVKDFKGNDPKFLYYFLQTLKLENFDTGSSNPTLNRNHLHKIEVWFPSDLMIQRKIAGVLSAYDDLIENNRRRIAILEKMAEEIYREWFVRMRFPGHQNAKCEKGVPVGWEVKRLNEILTLSYGKALKSDDRQPGNVPVYGSGGVVGYHDRAMVNRPGLIVGRKGNVGSVYLSDEPFFPIDTVYYVESKLSLLYLYFLLQSMNFINNDAAVPGLNRNQAYSNQCFSPPRDLIDRFDAIVTNTHEKAKTLRRSNNVLSKTRDALLGRLISGKLPVDELDIQLPSSMTEDAAEETSEEVAHAE
ncbi:MAG: restriction endonuclease subunit S [Planctomycetaceae bacterium]|nr:restriction endonuclease subunit S [Planctomycetaceae bacterium]